MSIDELGPIDDLRRIIVVTGIRSEYDILQPIFLAARSHPNLSLSFAVTGAHLSSKFGSTVDEIEKDGFPIAARIESLIDSDTWSARVKGMGLQLLYFTELFARERPSMVVAMGDREETITTSIAAGYCRIPIAHIGGGDNANDGNIDNAARHAVTKLAHLHLVTTERSASRIRQLGEEPWRIHVVGASGVDKFVNEPHLSRDQLLKQLKLDWGESAYVVALLHPTLMDAEHAGSMMSRLLRQVAALDLHCVAIHPNSDPGNFAVSQAITSFVKSYPKAVDYKNLPRSEFVNLMRHAHALLGNSSCGLIEAPTLGLPVVNIGIRQRGREHAANVVFIDPDETTMHHEIKRAVFDKDRRAAAKSCTTPYGDGQTGQRIARILAQTPLDNRLINKSHLFAADGHQFGDNLS